MRLFYKFLSGLLFLCLYAGFTDEAIGQTFTIRSISIDANTRAFYEYLPMGYDPNDTVTYPLIVTLHGQGDLGNGTAASMPLLLRSGITQYISLNRFPSSFTLNGQTFKFIVISPQFVNPMTPSGVDNVINYALSHYKVNPGRVYLTGLSLGGGGTWEYAGNNSTYANKVAAIVPISGQSSPTTARARVIANANLPVWATHNDGDPQVPPAWTNDWITMINAAPAPVPAAIKTIFHSNQHDAWTQTCDPNFKMNNLNIYQWMLQYTRQVIGVNRAPIANAGSNQVITLPTNMVTLSGSGTDADGSVSGYAWTQVGGTAAVITSPGSATTTVTGLTTPGVRTFRLTVTDNKGAPGTSDMTITVSGTGVNLPPIANAGVDQSVSLPTTSGALNGSAVDSDGAVASHTWTFVGGPVTPVITTPGSYTTTITGMTAPGAYTFRLTAIDNIGATGTDDVVITVVPIGNTRTINVNLYGTASYNNPAWNNWNVVSSLTSSALKYSDGGASTISTVLSAQNGYSDNGANYPVTMCPQQVGRDCSYGTAVRRDTLKGLDNSKLYDIQLYATRGNAGQTTRFTVNGVNVDIATNTNYTNIATFSNIAPANQKIVITIANLAAYNYLNGFTLTEKTVTGVPPPTPQPPVADAGADQSITLPLSSVTLSGSGSEQGGKIISYGWSQNGGPNTAVIATPSTASTIVTGLIQGQYRMKLTVTDSLGVTASDTMNIIVNPVVVTPPPPPGALPAITVSPVLDSVTTDSILLSSSATSGLPLKPTTWTKFSVPGQALLRFTVVGSSTSAGTGATVPDSAYINRLKAYYKAQGIIDTVYNLAIGGSWVGDVDITTALNKGAPILLVNYPSNNYNATTNAAAIAKFQEIKDSCDARGVQFYCTGTAPRGITNYDAAGRANLIVLNDSLRNRFGSRFMDFLTPMLDTTNNGIKAAYSYGDDIHVNNAGHERYFQIVRAFNIFKNNISSAAVINSPSQVSTLVRGLVPGVHRFQAAVLDKGGFAASAVATVKVKAMVVPRNQPPVAKAGADKTITLPVAAVNLDGSASTDDHHILTYNWSVLSGPGVSDGTVSAPVLTTPGAVTTIFSGLSQGIYKVQLTVTDDSSAVGLDTVIVTVNAVPPPPPPNQPPVAHAGAAQTITLPTASANLSGSGTDPDGTVVSYIWSEVGGPGTASITNGAGGAATVSSLVQGVYLFLLTVTDNLGAKATDSMTVTVNPAPVVTTRVINVNLYGSATYSNAAWNNWNVVSSLTSAVLKYSDGSTSTITSVLSAQNGYSDNGASYPVTMCPQQVGRDASYATSTRTNTLKGLDNTKLYDIQLYTTRGNAGQTTRFTVNGTSVDIATNSNFTNIATFSNVTPSNGNIVITLANLSTYNYLNGFTLTEKTAQTTGQAIVGAGVTGTGNSLATLTAAAQPVRIFPNPAKDQFIVDVNTPQTGAMKILVLNSSGVMISQVESMKTQADIQVKIPAGSLPTGSYIIRVIIGNWAASTQVIKL